AQVGLEAGGEDHPVALAERRGEVLFQLFVDPQRPIGDAGSGAAAAVASHRVARGGLHLRMKTQSEVVVGAEHQDAASVEADLAGPQHLVEDSVEGAADRTRKGRRPGGYRAELVE